ncbi:hypothetical protein ACRRTK_015346 [Alexandromys fortis]
MSFDTEQDRNVRTYPQDECVTLLLRYHKAYLNMCPVNASELCSRHNSAATANPAPPEPRHHEHPNRQHTPPNTFSFAFFCEILFLKKSFISQEEMMAKSQKQ